MGVAPWLALPVELDVALQVQLASSRIVVDSRSGAAAAVKREGGMTLRSRNTAIACKACAGCIDLSSDAQGDRLPRDGHSDLHVAPSEYKDFAAMSN